MSEVQAGIRRFRGLLVAAVTPESGSSGDRNVGNMAKREIWDWLGCSLGTGTSICFSLGRRQTTVRLCFVFLLS